METFFEGVSFTVHKGLLSSFTIAISFAWLIGYFNFNILVALITIPFLLYWTNVVTEKFVNKKVEEIGHENFILPEYETAEWLNLVITQLWKMYPNSIAKVLIDTLEPSLQASKPFFVRDVGIQEMSLGNKPPKIRKVKTCRQNYKNQNLFPEFATERDILVDIKFRSSIDLQINISVFLFGMNTPVPFLISDIFLDCWIRLTIRLDPHGNKLFEHIKISAINEPKLFVGVQPLTALKKAKANEYKKAFKIVHIPDLMQIPLLREWLNITFVTELKRSIRFPNSIDIYQSDLKIFVRKDADNAKNAASASAPLIVEASPENKETALAPRISAKELTTMADRIKRNSTNPHKFADKVVDSISKVKEAVANEFENLVASSSEMNLTQRRINNEDKNKQKAFEPGRKSSLQPQTGDFLSKRSTQHSPNTPGRKSNPFSSRMKGSNHNEV